MKVLVAFDFPSITDPSGPGADAVVDHITTLTKYIHNEFIVEHPDSSVWVDDVYADEYVAYDEEGNIKFSTDEEQQ